MRSRSRWIGGAALAAAFVLLAILNSGGYRYAASDQAFYLPAIMRAADPSLFPRDRALLATQDHLLLLDDGIARLMAWTGAPIERVMLVAYIVMLLAVAGAGWMFGRALFDSRWTAVALVLAMSIRHRVPKTGVNTLEHYFHPRMLAFAMGVAALALLVRRRTWPALVLAVLAGALHPTTGLWFTVAAGAGALITDRERRPWLLAAALVAGTEAAWIVWSGRIAHRLVTMDAEWLAILASKDYLFPTGWSLETWAQHVLYIVVIAATWRARCRRDAAKPGEAALVAGLAATLALFLASLPFVHARLALAVQLQVSRTFWLLDLVSIAYVAWWLVEAPWRRGPWPRRARAWAAVIVAVAALARGSYVMFVEKAGNPLLLVELRDDEWKDVMRWAASQPPDLHVLADPGHAWRYGSSVRAAAGRDVYLEEVKDAAMAMYSRDMAMRVLERTRALGDFGGLTAGRARALAASHDLHVLITEATLDLPVAYRNDRFTVYEIGDVHRAGRGSVGTP